MKEKIELTVIINTSPETLCTAWLSRKEHWAMTVGEAEYTNIEGAQYSAWDGYITRTNTKLLPFSEIQQNWRTTKFSDNDKDSHLTVRFNKHQDGTELTLIHTDIPEGQTHYKSGWKDHYFEPINQYFN